MRPIYETAEDRENQRIAITPLMDRWKCDQAIEFPTTSAVDFLLLRDNVPKAWVEVKNRTNTRGKYATYMLSEAKWDELLSIKKSTAVPSFVLVAFSDQHAWVPVNDEDYQRTDGGRRDRNDPQDIERVIHIPTGSFQEVVR